MKLNVQPLNADGYRTAIGMFATGVAVITTARDEALFGVTVNSLTSVSLSPLLLLVSLKRGSITAAAIVQSGKFGVNILGADQETVSRRFVAPVDDRFEGMDFDLQDGVPLLNGCVAGFVCRVERCVEAGDHTVIIGSVDKGDALLAEPLVFHRGAYTRLGMKH